MLEDTSAANCGTFCRCETEVVVLLLFQILALVAVRKAMDYMFSQHDLSFLDDVIPEKDKKKKEDEKKKRSSLGSDAEDVSVSSLRLLPALTS